LLRFRGAFWAVFSRSPGLLLLQALGQYADLADERREQKMRESKTGVTMDLLHACSHLSFHGYKDSTFGDDYFVMTHPDKISLTVKHRGNFITLLSTLGGNDFAKSHRHEYIEWTNSLNTEAILVRFFIYERYGFAIYACFIAPYEKSRFSAFYSAWEFAIQKILLTDRRSEFLKFFGS
jgi:hypothetical protein